MAVATRTTTWSDGQVLTAAALNGEFNNLLGALAIVNADISGSAAIAISKISTGLSGSIVGTTDTQTLTNKRLTRRVSTAADGTSIDVNSDNFDEVKQVNTQGSGTLTINAPTGTPTDGQGLIYAIKSTNSQTYSFNATFKGGATPLPSTHAGGSKWDFLGFKYSSSDSNWKLLATQQATA